jgi:hypothetical protein
MLAGRVGAVAGRVWSSFGKFEVASKLLTLPLSPLKHNQAKGQ